MKKNLFLLIAAAVMMASCAEKVKDISASDWEEQVIEKWLEVNYPNESILTLEDGGGYVIEHSISPSGNSVSGNYNYVRFDLTGRLLDGSIFKTTRRSEGEILMYKTATFYSRHFVPIFDSLGSSNIPAGITEMIQQRMKEGDSVVLLLPSHKAYGGSTYSESGYAAGVAANTPVIFEIALREVIPSSQIIDYERRMVRDYVDSMNQKFRSKSEKEYARICDTTGCPDNIYVRYIDTTPVTDSTPLPQTDTVLSLKYAGFYLDGFWLDTNIDSVARRFLKSTYKLQTSYLPTSTYSHTFGSTGSIAAFNAALGRLNKGSTIEFVFTSEYGYGAAGSGNVPPYTPLRFFVHRVK